MEYSVRDLVKGLYSSASISSVSGALKTRVLKVVDFEAVESVDSG